MNPVENLTNDYGSGMNAAAWTINGAVTANATSDMHINLPVINGDVVNMLEINHSKVSVYLFILGKELFKRVNLSSL